MQANQLTIAHPAVGQINSSSVTTKLADWVARVFGCWHSKMSRPFSYQGHAYRSCLNCGAQRQFNLSNWKMQGEFFYRNATTNHFYGLNQMAAVRKSN